MNKKTLIDLIGILLIALVVLVGYKLSPMLLPKVDLTLQPDPACNLQQQACSVALPEGGSIALTFGTRPVPLVKPFDLSVTVNGIRASRVEVDFSGVEMNMGFIRPELSLRSDGHYVATSALPVCVTGAMDWQVTVLIETFTQRIAIPFRLTTLEHR